MNRRSSQGTPPIDLMETAVHDLRGLPATAHLTFLIGTVPFLLGLMVFWADMSRGAFADRRCASEALGLAGLYIWMKAWHAVYCTAVRTQIDAMTARPWTFSRWFGVLCIQAAWQPWGLILVPLSVLPLMVPLPWAVAWFRHIDVLADHSDGSARRTLVEAARAAKRWPGQNHGLFALFLLVGLVIWINVMVVLSQLPSLIKMLTGLESDFTLSTAALVFNGTFLLSAVCVSYLVWMPLVLAAYTRRGFEAEALHTGADLRAELRRLRPASVSGLLVPLILVLGIGESRPGRLSAEEPDRPAATAGIAGIAVAPATLDRTIDEVLDRPEFSWRQRRELGGDEAPLDPNAGWWERLRRRIQRMGDAMANAVKAPGQAIGRSVQRILEWLFNKGGSTPRAVPTGSDQVDWMTGIKILLYAILAGALAWLSWYGSRLWRSRRQKPVDVAAAPVLAVPDLTAETVSAAALPEDGWLQLARELAGKGDYRLAIRAIYLAELAHLAHRELVRLAGAKSNRDYQRELERRARALPGIPEAFGGTVLAFDRIWYGRHEATRETLERTEAWLAQMRSVA